MAKKHRDVMFALPEQDRTVRARLEIDGATLLSFENEEAPPARVRGGAATVEKLLESAQFWAPKDPRFNGPSGWLEFIVHRRKEEAYKQILEVRKALRRIEGAMTEARNAKQAMVQLSSGNDTEPPRASKGSGA